MHQHFKFICKYWPDDGALRPKRLANNRIIIEQIELRRTEYIFNFINAYCTYMSVKLHSEGRSQSDVKNRRSGRNYI